MGEKRPEGSSLTGSGDWQGFLDTFSNENRRRTVSVEIVGVDVGDQPLASGAKLDAIAYDPSGKGDDVVISFESGVHHPIQSVTELWTARKLSAT